MPLLAIRLFDKSKARKFSSWGKRSSTVVREKSSCGGTGKGPVSLTHSMSVCTTLPHQVRSADVRRRQLTFGVRNFCKTLSFDLHNVRMVWQV